MKNLFALPIFFVTTLFVAHSAAARDISDNSIPEILDIEGSSRATMVCPFTVINGPKVIGEIDVNCYTDTNCSTPGGNYAWGGRGATPTLTNRTLRLSNDAMANAGLTALTTTQSIIVSIFNPAHAQFSQVCMQATVSAGTFACTGGPYTLDINNL